MEDMRQKAVAMINKILELEMTGVMRYTHYSFFIVGYHRIPIMAWLKDQASESLLHAQEAGNIINHLDGKPEISSISLVNADSHGDLNKILKESAEHEAESLKYYKALHALVKGKSIFLEDYATKLIVEETNHLHEVHQMIKQVK